MYWILKSLEWIIGLLPLQGAVRSGRFLGWLAGSVIRFRRNEVETTLATCFPEKDSADLRRIARDMYLHFGGSLSELFWYCRRGTDSFASKMIYSEEQFRLMNELKARHKGVLILTAHMGNFELFGTFAALFNHPVTAVVKPIKNAGVQRFWDEQRDNLLFDVLPWRRSFRDCLRLLRDNRAVAMIMDQNTIRSHGVFVNFFDRQACTTPGLAVLAAQSGAPVLPAFMVSRDMLRHELVFGEVIEPPPDKSPETIQRYTQIYTSVIESWIRDCPEQWIWLHRRWRTQPKSKPETNDETA